jgi:DNA-binding NarL/FixJ family response regulator
MILRQPLGPVAFSASPIRVLVADDHAAVRAGVRFALEQHGAAVCAEADDAGAAVRAALRERPDACLVDEDIPGGASALTCEITAKLPETAVIVIASSPTDEGLLDALRAGASGYLGQNTNPDRLAKVIDGVLHGEAAISRRLVTRLIEEFRRRGAQRPLAVPDGRAVQLTGREWEVLELLRDGQTTGEIAGTLFIAPGTVRTHVAAILRKLHVPDRDAALELLSR